MLRKSAFFPFLVVAVFFTIPFAVPTNYTIVYSDNLHSISAEQNATSVSRDLEHPDIEVEPNAIEEELITGESVECILNFTNLGDEDVRFSILPELINEPDRDYNISRQSNMANRKFPSRDDPGDILFQFELESEWCAGFDWDPDENVMWVASYNPPRIHAYAYNGRGGVENIFNRQLNPSTLAMGFLDGIVYTNQYPRDPIYMYNQEGDALGELELDINQVVDCATSKEDKWLLVLGASFNIHVYDVENEYENVGIIDGELILGQMEGIRARSMCWVDDHTDGQLWLGSQFRAWQFLVDTDSWEVELVQEFPTPSGHWLAIGHDGENIWRPSAADDNLVQVYDDGNIELSWVTFDPEEGDIEAGGDLDVVVIIDATGLNGGEYEVDVHFISNDIDNPDVVVSIQLNVIGAPDLVVEWSEDAGFPELLDWNQFHEDLFPGGPYEIPVRLSNIGTEVLRIEAISSEHEYYSSSNEEPFEIQISETILVDFIFDGEAPGEFISTMNILSDDPDENRVEIDLNAVALLPPVAVIGPDGFERDLLNDEEADLVVNIANEGDALLRWRSDLEVIDGREIDEGGIRRIVRRVDGNTGNPLRDQINGRGILIADVCGWNQWDYERYFWAIDDLNFDRFRHWREVEDVDFNNYDFMWLGNFESDGWVVNYNANLERIEEFVDNGGTLYHCSGSNRHNIRPVNPGGLIYTWGEVNGDEVQNDCPLTVNPDDNFLVNYMNENDEFEWEWSEGQRLNGAAHGVFLQEDVEDLENSNWHQIMAMGNPVNEPIILTYRFGTGYVLVSTTVDGFVHARQNECQWGRTGVGVIHYLDFLSNFCQWLTWEPRTGEIESAEDEDVSILLHAEGIVSGEYNSEIHFYTNDPAMREVIVEISLNVTGVPNLEVEWDELAGYPNLIDWNGVYDELFTGVDQSIIVEVINLGTDELIVENVSFNNEYFTSDPQQLIVPALDSRMIELTLFSEEDGDHEGILTLTTNDPDNEEWQVPVRGTTESSPIMEIEPDEIEEVMMEGEVNESEITIVNSGALDLIWTSKAEIIEEPDRDQKPRSLRSNRSKTIGPQRDPFANGALDGLRFACFTTNSDWEWIDEGMGQDPLLNQNNFIPFRRVNDLAEVEFQDYDGLVFNLYNQRFMDHYYENMERLIEYIDGGGGAYFETGNIQRHRTPGGISNDQNDRCANGVLLVSPNRNDDNYSRFADILHSSEPDYWLEGEIIEGDYWLHSTYSHGQFERAVRNGVIDWFQPIAGDEENPDRWGAIAYGIGRGIILTVGHPAGDCWFNWADNGGQWGSIAAEILYYISETTSQWLSWEPMGGEIRPGGDDEIIVTLNSEGVMGGIYGAEIYLYSNDPVEPEGEPDHTISIVMEIIGMGRILVEPGGPEENESFDFGVGYIGFPKMAEFNITNIGSEVLTIVESISDNEVFYVNEEVEFPFNLDVDEDVIINVAFNAGELEDNQEATIRFITDPPHNDWENGYPINVIGDGLEAPVIVVFPDEIGGDYGGGELEEFALTVANEGGSTLVWETDFELFEQPGIDNPHRSVREIVNSMGPLRDEPGDIIDQFNSGLTGCSGMTSTLDGLVWGCSNSEDRVVSMNTEDGEVIDNWGCHENPMGITWTGEEFWISQWTSPTIFRYNIEGDLIEQFEMNFRNITGMGCDRQNFVYVKNATHVNEGQFIRILDIEELDEVGRINILGIMDGERIAGIEWVPQHPDGQLWGIADSRIYQIAVDEEENAQIVQEFETLVDSDYAGPAHDGENLWYGMWEEEDWYKIEDGIEEQSFVICEPTSGELEEDAEIEVIAIISTEDLRDGFYEGTLFFSSNDPDTPFAEVNVRVSVNGRSIITAEPVQPVPIADEEDALITFEDTYIIVAASEFELVIQNIGDVEIEIEQVLLEGDEDDFGCNILDGVVIPARGDVGVILTFAPIEAGQKEATLILRTNAMNVEDGIVWWSLTGLGQVVPDTEFYVLPFARDAAPDARHSLIVNELMWDNEVPPAGWEIGVFTEANELGGSVVWLDAGPVEFFAYGAEGDFDGFEEGGSFTFKVWDNEAEDDSEIEPNFIEGPETWENGGETTLELHGGEIAELLLDLQESWNLISINIDPRQFYSDDEERGPSVPLLFEQLENEEGNQPVELLKDELGQFWVPEWDFTNIDFWNLTQGYQVCLTEAAEAAFQGRRIAPDADIPIEPGWNFIVYFPEYDLDSSAPDFYVLSPIFDSLIHAKDGQGRFMSMEFRFSNMVPWTQGQGYHVKIDAEVPIILNYPPEREDIAVFGLEECPENKTFPIPSSQNMSILINSISGVEPHAGDIISAYSPLGKKIGSGEFTSNRCGMAVWGDEEMTETIEGALKDEEFALKFWDADENAERNLDVKSVLAGNGLTFESNGFTALDVEVQSAVPKDYYLSQNFPNPFNSKTRLTYGSPENAYVSLSVFDMNGRVIEELLKGTVVAGNYTVTWYASNVSAGIYLVQMKSSTGFKSVVKVMLLK